MAGTRSSERPAEHGRRILIAALTLLLAAAVAALIGCDGGSTLPERPEPVEEDPAPDTGVDPDDLQGIEDFTQAAVYSGTSSDVKRLSYLPGPGEYRFVCTVDFAPGDAPVPVSFWAEGPGGLTTPAIEVFDGSSDEFYFEIPQTGNAADYTVAAEAGGFASWEVTVYRRK